MTSPSNTALKERKRVPLENGGSRADLGVQLEGGSGRRISSVEGWKILVDQGSLGVMSENAVKPLVYMTKTEALEQAIGEMAKVSAPGSKLPSMGDLIRKFQVSKVTLDIALKELERRGAIVRKNGVGIFVAPRPRQKTVGLVFGFDIFNSAVASFYRRFLEIAQQQAQFHEVQFRYYFDIPRSGQEVPAHDELIEDIRSGRVHGLMGVGILPATMVALEKISIPLVDLFSGHGRHAVHEVGVDMREIIRLGVKALVGSGCRRIGMIYTGGLARCEAGEDQRLLDVFRQAIEDAGLDASNSWDFEHPATRQTGPDNLILDHIEWSRKTTLEFFKKHRKEGQRMDGLLSLDDQLTFGALLAFDELKVEAGKDVKIATEAIRDMPQFSGRELIRLEIDLVLIARAMHQTLQALMEEKIPEKELVLVPPLVSYQHRSKRSSQHA